MAIQLTDEQLAEALRLPQGYADIGSPTHEILRRLRMVGSGYVNRYASNAPEEVQIEAVIRLAAYLYDQPTVGGASEYSSAWRNSGAYALCSPWIERGLEDAQT